MAMAEFDLTESWQQVFDGTSQDKVVLQSSEPCELAIATVVPSAGLINIAIRLREKPQGSGYEFASSGMTGQKIYARETSGYSKSKVTVASW